MIPSSNILKGWSLLLSLCTKPFVNGIKIITIYNPSVGTEELHMNIL